MARLGHAHGHARRRRRIFSCLIAATGTLSTVVATAGASSASATALVTDPAALVNPFIGTSGAVDTFPGPDMPFGMMQWSPDTSPDRPAGGGYEYDDNQVIGYSLTHISGPGCGAYGDLPILPTVGAIGSNPGSTTVGFDHADETATIGRYSAKLANGVAVNLTDATRSGIGQFVFPAGTQSNLLLKLSGSADSVAGTSATVVGDNQVTGSVTAGQFCGAPTSWENNYTLHFDITFSQPFTASGTWGGTASSTPTANSRTVTQHATSGAKPSSTRASSGTPSSTVFSGAKPDFTPKPRSAPTVHPAPKTNAAVTNPGGVYLTFDTTNNQTVTAKVGISFTDDANARLNVATEIPGWNFGAVEKANKAAWNAILSRIQIGGGTSTQQTEFYTALYHALLHPNVFSDVNGQYMGFDNKIHTAAKGHAQYANYSGWDIYRSQVQLAALVAPQQTSDSIRSMLNDYEQSGELPKWALANGESYVMVGDPADGIIADAYAFGARDFNHAEALAAMIKEATTPSDIRPGLAQYEQDGYLPYDGSYGCCNFYGPVSTGLEYNAADYAIASFAKSLGDTADYTKFATRAQTWQNSFNVASGYLQAKLANGEWVPGFTPGTGTGFVEGTAAQYTPMVNFNLQGLIAAKGGDSAYNGFLDSLLSNLTDPSSTNADLSNEPSIEIPWEYDFTGEPYRTQEVVREAQQELYFDAPVGQDGNDDLGAMSSWFVWSNLGMYPETPGTSTLVFGSPVFPKTVLRLAGGRTLTIDAPNAATANPYVQALTVNGTAYQDDWTTEAALRQGGTWTFDLGSTPNKSWGADTNHAPPSDATGEQAAFTAAGPGSGLILNPGASASASATVTNVTGTPLSVSWTAKPSDGVTVSPASGSLTVPANGSASAAVTVSAGSTEGADTVTFAFTAGSSTLPSATLNVNVAKPGELWPYYTNEGVATDGQPSTANFDGDGFSYSANALAALGITPGGTVTSDGIDYTWPAASPTGQDNIEASGQTIPVDLPAGATKIGLLGSASNGGGNGATGTMTVTYNDGSTQQVPIVFGDWTLGAGGDPLPSGDTIVADTPYRDDTSGGSQAVGTYLFSFDATLSAGKTVASVTLPATVSNGDIHVFDIAGD
jgi:predicted alpha-1,2-mannosidase